MFCQPSFYMDAEDENFRLHAWVASTLLSYLSYFHTLLLHLCILQHDPSTQGHLNSKNQ